jgi:hypothetical protein
MQDSAYKQKQNQNDVCLRRINERYLRQEIVTSNNRLITAEHGVKSLTVGPSDPAGDPKTNHSVPERPSSSQSRFQSLTRVTNSWTAYCTAALIDS